MERLVRGAGNHNQRHIAMLQVRGNAIVVVCPERAARTAFGPIRPEHEVSSWLFPANRSARVSLPCAPSNTYSLSTFTHGSSRRSALSRSRWRVNAFSLAKSALRAPIQSSLETTGCFLMTNPLSIICKITLQPLHRSSPPLLVAVARRQVKEAL